VEAPPTAEAEERIYSDNPRLAAVPVCRVCGERVHGLVAHLLTCHQLTLPQYRSGYPPPPHRVRIYHRSVVLTFPPPHLLGISV
jgi:hypothetical protein